jgi:hypothetical protein
MNGSPIEPSETTDFWRDHCRKVLRGLPNDQEFPTVEDLWRGVVTHGIARALWLAANSGGFPAEADWDGMTYTDDNGSGDNWSVTFADVGTVAVFFWHESERSPYSTDLRYDPAIYLTGMPDALLNVARQRTLPTMFDEQFALGTPNGVVTAAMWSTKDGCFTAAEPWPFVFEHGAHLAVTELLPPDVAAAHWADYYDLTAAQRAVLISLAQRVTLREKGKVMVSPEEREVFLTAGNAAAPGDRGVAACRDWLASFGIILL